jgi:hypothetical protein
MIAAATNVALDWLLTGIGDMTGATTPGPLSRTQDNGPPPPTAQPPPDALSPRQRALLGLFDGLTLAQQDALIRELEDKKRLNDDLLADLLARRQAS